MSSDYSAPNAEGDVADHVGGLDLLDVDDAGALANAEDRGLAELVAERISEMPRFALAKKSVNAAEDTMGQRFAMDSGFALHQLAHVQNELETGSRTKSKQVGDVRKVVERDGGGEGY